MCTSSYIKKHIHRLEPGQLFTTRDLLHYGPRGAIDQTIYRLIKKEIIIRVARGVFAKEGVCEFSPSPYEVAKIKAESFGRMIVAHAKDSAHKLQLMPDGNEHIVYATNGSSSSFLFENQRIYFRKICPRNMQLAQSPIGEMIRALAYIGKEKCNKKTIYDLIHEAGKKPRRPSDEVRQDFQNANLSMPAWLVNSFPWYKDRQCTWHGVRNY